jgi:hypothetical protein
MAIVVYAHRPKRPPPKQKASALARAAKAAAAPELHSAPGTKSVIVKPTSEKLLKRLRMERAQQPSGEPGPEIDAFFARNVRPGGPLPPERKP